MAITLVNNLYPPVIDSYMPAYIQSTGSWNYRVYIDISQFNSFSDIRADLTQILITNINNENMAASTNEYLIKTIHSTDSSNPLNRRCYFDLTSADVKSGIIPINTYYKLQLRFTSADCKTSPTSSNFSKWLSENSMYFSEWSTVCLLSVVTNPTVALENFTASLPEGTIDGTLGSTSNYSANKMVELKLEMSFPQGKVISRDDSGSWSVDSTNVDCVEAIKNCTIKLYDNNKQLLLESGSLYSDVDKRLNVVYNIINYKMQWNFIEGNSYYLIFKFTTSKMLEKSYYLHFTIVPESTLITSSSFKELSTFKENASVMGYQNEIQSVFIPDEENGRLKIGITKAAGEYLYLKRSSSKTNFTIWEDLKFYNYTSSTDENIIEYDTTLESGTAYKYALQGVNRNNSGDIRKSSKEKYFSPCLFDNAFLIADNKVLVIKYNQNITNYKRNVIETKIDTIGSQYPFVRRNGHADYRQISISGMITAIADVDEVFGTKEDILGGLLLKESEDSKTFYDTYKETYGISQYNDVILEREFREKISDFLYKNNVKLFKSSQEGNMLLRLMEISLTPEQQLGRNIYSFSCTGYEIGEPSVSNYKKYNIYQSEITK